MDPTTCTGVCRHKPCPECVPEEAQEHRGSRAVMEDVVKKLELDPLVSDIRQGEIRRGDPRSGGVRTGMVR
jgi:hypothetical protein